ncbi:MAG: endonuclease MutS2, partial [Bacteroidetes bacterium]|jgi:DNA mismatch repair protein MutS2|nr:endonuclease MutS2 [Bacteroidota bacterium]
LHQRTRRLTPLPDIEERIREIVDEDGRVQDDASPELRRIRRLIIQRQADLREALNRELRSAVGQGYATEDQPTIRNGRMVIPVRAEAKRKVEGFVQDSSASGQTVYIEPAACLHLNNEVRELKSDERREIDRILRAMTKRLRGELDALRQNVRILSMLDLLQAKAKLANELDAVVPTLDTEGVVELRNGRHPALLLHRLQQDGEGEPVVPLTLTLGEDYQTLLITGPNAGGKTVAMKTVGVLALMLAYGLPIPADDTSRMPVFDQVFVDIGDEQSIEEDLSTFSSHISNLRYVLKHATDRSLVLIDEAGTGTDPDEGGALAQAMLERLNERHTRTIATTHHGTLKVFAHQTEGVENGSMEFDHKTLRPTYRFQPAVPGSSYAFEIAERMGLAPDLISRARTLVGEQKAALEDLITTLERRTQALAARLKDADETLKKAQHEKQKYQERLQKSEKERTEIRQQALEEAERIVNEANARIERTIREIKEAEAEREATKQARERLESFKETVGDSLEAVEDEGATEHEPPAPNAQNGAEAEPKAPATQATGPLAVGDRVRLDEGAMTGEVQALENGEAVITAGAMRMRVDRKRLTKVGGPTEQRVTVNRTSSGSEPAIAQASRSVDLRGYRVEEALTAVRRHLDTAMAANLNQVEILHGKGTGALREAIHEHLSQEPAVASFREAPLQHGGSGVTLVDLA